MENCSNALVSFFGIVYAGGCYCFLNPELPLTRQYKILETLDTKVIITDAKHIEYARANFAAASVLLVDDLMKAAVDEEVLEIARTEHLDIDPLYINFTSGSTGTPKGIAVGHASVIDFIDQFTTIFGFSDKDIFANQAPFDFDVSVKDIYSVLKVGATLAIIPRPLFSQPAALMDYICDAQTTVLVWAVSALCLLSTAHALEYRKPETLKKVLFSGEVMPVKHLGRWMTGLEDAMFVNLYGPTEITCNCTYHIIDRQRDYAEAIPIGRPFPNEEVFLLDENNKQIQESELPGEVCVKGTCLALGYYKAPELTNASFCPDPRSQTVIPSRIYRTGDLAMYNSEGELVFCGRKDFQIKHMGHRIELEEIMKAMEQIDGVERSCCIYLEKRSRLKGFYVGSIEPDEVIARMKETLPYYMIPGFIRRLDEFVLNKNGKIDRKALEDIK